ncbi:MAG: hypothetical protein ABSE82_00465 [Nitrososphaerales archaeon]
MSIVNGSVAELVPSSEQIKQCISKSSLKEQLVLQLLRIFTDVFGILPLQYCKIAEMI